ncbi:MAG: RNA polymerase sporulation sigma factor SigE [Clostridiales bacterium]|jgi:RNA polymerase sporulation-specific sigma factor|nr:RNA polymerase sporulation sigma factor SigE [Clostridiales bacterium]
MNGIKDFFEKTVQKIKKLTKSGNAEPNVGYSAGKDEQTPKDGGKVSAALSGVKDFLKKVPGKAKEFFSFGKDKDKGNGKGVDYISGGEALPKPLEATEEYDAVTRLQRGDLNAKTELIEHNLRLVVYIAKRFENTGVDIEDLISVGTIGLIKGVNSFNLEKNIKLATYASRCIENEILMHLRKISKIKLEVSLDEPLNVDWEGNMLLLGDILGTEPDGIYKNIETTIEKDMLIESYKKLSDREKLIIRLRFGILGADEKTQKEIAEMMGISQSYISRLEKKIISRLKREMTKMAR